MNYIIIGTVILCVAAVIAVSMNFFRRCKCNEEPADEDEKILEKAGHLIEDLDPVEGPEPTDTDNPYTVTFNEPLEIADTAAAATNIEKLSDIHVTLGPADIGKALESIEKKDIVKKQGRKRKADTAKAEPGKKKPGRKRKADTAKTEPKQKKTRTVKQSDIVKAAKKLRVKKGE